MIFYEFLIMFKDHKQKISDLWSLKIEQLSQDTSFILLKSIGAKL
jgi:hypothetical protein